VARVALRQCLRLRRVRLSLSVTTLRRVRLSLSVTIDVHAYTDACTEAIILNSVLWYVQELIDSINRHTCIDVHVYTDACISI